MTTLLSLVGRKCQLHYVFENAYFFLSGISPTTSSLIHLAASPLPSVNSFPFAFLFEKDSSYVIR